MPATEETEETFEHDIGTENVHVHTSLTETKLMNVPHTIEVAGGLAKWLTDHEEPVAIAEAQKAGVKPVGTGDGGRLLVSDVQRAIAARNAVKLEKDKSEKSDKKESAKTDSTITQTGG